MKKLFLLILPVSMLLFYFGCQEVPNDVDTGSSLYLLTPDVCASGWVDYIQGTNRQGIIYTGRDDPNAVLGAPDDIFFSLGMLPVTEKYIIVEFDQVYSGDNLLIYEATHSSLLGYPIETADVYVSSIPDPYNWVYLGEANNKGATDDYLVWESSIPLNGENVRYVKILETSILEAVPPYPAQPSNADGFDLDAVCIENLRYSETAFAYNCDDDARDCFSIYGFNRWGWTNGLLVEGTYYFDLYAGAGQCDIGNGIRVGSVTVVYVGGTATVTFETCGDFVMSETHLYVGNEELPRDKKDKLTVAPGQYPYKHDELSDVTTDEYTVSGLSDAIYVVAHAVVSGFGDFENWTDCGERGCIPPCNEWVIYGSNLGTGTGSDAIYAIDLNNQTRTLVYDPGAISSSQNYPNANAYDPINKRIYFGTDDGRLFYHQIGSSTHVPVATGLGTMACGAWYNGKYYYVKNGTTQLYAVDNGTASLIGNVPTNNGYGDIVFDPHNPGVFVGSAGNPAVWYAYDINSNASVTLTKTGDGGDGHKQLAYGSDGVLYGVQAIGGEFFTVDYSWDDQTVILASFWNSGYSFTDLASGPQCQ